MKNRTFLRLISFVLTVIMLASAATVFGASAEFCLHQTVKTLLPKADGSEFTIAEVCELCGETVSENGIVKTGNAITVYKEAALTTAYTASELETGFINAAGNALYAKNDVISKTGVPYWLSFDLKVNSLPKIPVSADKADKEANLDNSDSRAYKGWSVICLCVNSYDAPLRYIPDGWEEGSGAIGSTKGATDGKSPVAFSSTDTAYRFNPTAFNVYEGFKANVTMRIDPTKGLYDVYLNNTYVGSGSMGTRANAANSHIRFWEADGNTRGGSFDFTNIDVFVDDYTEIEHVHSYKETIHFFNDSFAKYSVCDCKDATVLETKNFETVVAPSVSHIYNGCNRFSFSSDNYWFATDINVRGKISDGNLIQLSQTVILKVKDGKIMAGDTAIAKVTYPTSYQVAVKITDNQSYDIYFNGIKVASGTKTFAEINKYRVYLGDEAFGSYVRFMYNRAVTLGDTDTSASINFIEDASIKKCYHEYGKNSASNYIKETNGVTTNSYICKKCGERVYAKITGSLVSFDNDTLFGYKPNAIKKSELASLTTDTSRILYLENGVIGKNAAPYWITFNLTPKALPSLDGLDTSDPNGHARIGYNVVSAEASFYPISELTVVPTENGAELRMLYQMVNDNLINYDTVVATLKENETVNVALYYTPALGTVDVYADGIYKASATKTVLTDYNPKITFHADGAGEFTYSDIRVATEANNFADSVNAFEFNAAYDANKTKPAGQTALVTIKRTTENAAYDFDMLYVDNRTGELSFKDINGNYNILSDKDGNAYKLTKSGLPIVAVYDDIRATIRYYIDGLVPYVNGGKLFSVSVNAEFANAAAVTDLVKFDTSIVSNLNLTGMESSGTLQVIALQQRITDDALRLVAGLDVPWYSVAGYRITLYDKNGNAAGKEVTATTTTMYDKIHADGVAVEAASLGYNYFVPFEIKGFKAGSEYDGYYLLVTPFTKVGGATLDGKETRININASGYEFAN